MKFFDAHCHKFTPTADVVGAIVNATNESEWNNLLASANDTVRVAIGVHPWNVDSVTDGWSDRMRDKLIKNPFAMVGECGLDGSRTDSELQFDVFLSQLRIAAALGRTIHVHCVRAWDQITRVFSSEILPPVIVMHAFSGSPEIIKQMPENVFYSFSPAILNVNHKHARASAMVCPADKILIESDDMLQSVLPDVARAVAEIRGVDPECMGQILLNNSQRIITNGYV